ncbi:AAA family ATPase [Brachyspira intermedia]|uniref:AAA family ATPase n=1 Tax=Brachyspira intermedia TaxID=84377 RepID=UPI00300621EB
MENHFVKNISFENFKCFKKLEFDGFKRVNLIGGQNNVGKTSFMEGVNLSVYSEDALNLHTNIRQMIKSRQNDDIDIDFFYNDENIINIKSNNKNVQIRYIKDHLKENRMITTPYFKLIVGYSEFELDIYDFCNDKIIIKDDYHFIHSFKADEEYIASLYGQLTNLGKEDYIDNSLKIFDENIIGIRQIFNNNKVTLKLKLKYREKPVLLSSFGEGINRYIAIICAIWASKDGYLFIDEIENGIHYTNYPKLWKLIFEISKEANCQIFAATHSKECIEAFNKENKDNDGLYLEFYRNQKTGIINIKDRDNEQLEYALLNNGEFRGE